jgi:hypothetical protein
MNHILHHSDGFVKRTVSIVRRISVLLQEVVFYQSSNFERDFVGFGK